MKLNCIVIDDEPLARKGIENFINETDSLQLSGSFANPLLAMEMLEKEKIDLMFLDIEMPKITGMAFLKSLNNPPLTIITTAYSDHAAEGFDLDVVDYLLKPIAFERFLKAVGKAKDLMERNENPLKNNSDFFIKCDNRIERIFYDDLLFVQAMENYVLLQTKTKKYVSYLTLKSVEEYLPADQFMKVHKSFIASVSKIDSIDGNLLKMGSHAITISRSYKDEIFDKILKDKYLKR